LGAGITDVRTVIPVFDAIERRLVPIRTTELVLLSLPVRLLR
jgi:hypothetical protein